MKAGESRGIAPTGSEYEISGIHVVRAEYGKFTAAWLNNDTVGLIQQLGVVELPMG